MSRLNIRRTALVLTLLLIWSLAGGALCEAATSPRENGAETSEAPAPEGIGEKILAAQGCGEDLQAFIDGPLCEQAGSNGDLYALGLFRLHPEQDRAAYGAALADIAEEQPPRSMASRLKLAFMLRLCGRGNHPFVSAAAKEAGEDAGVMAVIWALQLQCSGLDCGVTPEELFALQGDAGGWCVLGTAPDPDVTAMALQALARCGEDPAVGAAVEQGLAALSKMQLEDGSFESPWGRSAESVAQVILALCELGLDPETDPRFIKEGHTLFDALEQFRLADGTYTHSVGGAYNEMATAQVFEAMAAVTLLREGRGSLYGAEPVTATAAEDTTLSSEPAVQPAAENSRAAEGTMAAADEPAGREFPPEQAKAAEANNAPVNAEGTAEEAAAPKLSLKTGLLLILAGITLLCAGGLVLCKKKRTALAALLFGALLCGGLAAADLQSPAEYYGAKEVPAGEITGTVTLSIRCDVAVGLRDAAPQDGIILEAAEVDLQAGDTAFDLLARIAGARKIPLSHQGGYVNGIGGLFEQDCGELSGWMYRVNGVLPEVGADRCPLQDGDRVEWLYTRSMGKDLMDP